MLSFMIRPSLVDGCRPQAFWSLFYCRAALLWTLKPLLLASSFPLLLLLYVNWFCRAVLSVLQDIKDLMRKAGEVTFADINKDQDNQG